MTQTGIPASGLYGPGDYGPDFVTIDGLREQFRFVDVDVVERHTGAWHDYLTRTILVDTLITLAHDLDARGLVVVEEEAGSTEVMAFYAGFQAAVRELANGIREFSGMPAAGSAAKTFREFADGLEKHPVDNIVNKWLARQQADDIPPDPNTGS